MSHSNSVKPPKLKRRLLFKPLTCAADGCRNRFTPIREGHIYCSDTCSAYMRNRAKRERDRAKRFDQALEQHLQQEERERGETDAKDSKDSKDSNSVEGEEVAQVGPTVDAGVDTEGGGSRETPDGGTASAREED